MDKNGKFSFNKSLLLHITLVKILATALIIMGFVVPMGWHNYHLLFHAEQFFNGMAYSTAICFSLSGIGLLSLNLRKPLVITLCSLCILVISGSRITEILTTSTIDYSLFPNPTPGSGSTKIAQMNPVTAMNFILAAISLLASISLKQRQMNYGALVAIFISLMLIVITIIAFYDNAIVQIFTFTWFKIKIAPLTALGFILFSIGLIVQQHTTAFQSFNRMNVSNRLIVGFGFISILFIGAGFVAYMQIHAVAIITKELHQNPLQINYAALRIKKTITQLNRKFKDIAVKPQLIEQLDTANLLEESYQSLSKEIRLIHQIEPTLSEELQELDSLFRKWRHSILASEKLLKAGDTNTFRERTLNETQMDSVTMESLADQLILNAQNHIQELNQVILKTEQDAKNMLLISIAGLLGIGLLVASLITRSLTNQLQKIRFAMLDIAHGNTETVIPFLDYQEEIGDMAKTLETFSRNAAIRRSMEIRMSNIIEATPNGILMINQGGFIEVFNQQAEKIFGYSREQILGKPVEQLIPQRMAGNHPQVRRAFFADPTPRAMGVGRELFGLREDGSEFPLEIGLAPIETEEGTMVLASIVDISARKKAEQELREHQEELERSNIRLAQTNKELETFAYVASHDLKSPLRGIAQLSSWIEEDLAEKEFDGIDNHTSMLRNRIQRMEKLLDDLLLFYRAGKVDGALASLDLNQMAKELFEIQNNKPGLHLVVNDDLPVLTTLSTPFEQVLRNLFSNAIKHHDKSEGIIQLTCRSVDQDFYELDVCDDGPGIPKQFQERVFGMFQTLKPRDELEGSGMGLALIKKIVENYGGKIEVHSEGRGCCFRFTWPKHIKRRNGHD